MSHLFDCLFLFRKLGIPILLTETTAAQNEVVLSYHRVRGLHFLAVVFVATILLFTHTVFEDVVNSKILVLYFIISVYFYHYHAVQAYKIFSIQMDLLDYNKEAQCKITYKLYNIGYFNFQKL